MARASGGLEDGDHGRVLHAAVDGDRVELLADGLDAAVDEYVSTIAGFSGHVIALGKDTFYRQAGLRQRDAYSVAQPVMSDNAAGEHAQEGMSAFLDKRPPEWPD